MTDEDTRAPYERIVDHFRALIESGDLAPGDRLPTVRQIAETFSVARPTANKAVTTLSNEGLVVTGGRRGTVVRDRTVGDSVAVIVEQASAVAATEVSSASPTMAAQLGVEPGSPIVVLRLQNSRDGINEGKSGPSQIDARSSDRAPLPEYLVREENGERIVEWTINASDGQIQVHHSLPDALSHYYTSPYVSDLPILLHVGDFTTTESEIPLNGKIELKWRPVPYVEASGSGDMAASDYFRRLSADDEPTGTIWKDRPVLKSSDATSLRPAPRGGASVVSAAGNFSTTEHLGRQDHGVSDSLDRVTFLIANGWHLDTGGSGICDPKHLRRYWHGRQTATGGGWKLIIDERYENYDSAARKEIVNSHGNVVTHVGEIARLDGASFKIEETDLAFKALGMAFSLCLSRHSSALLPVGYQGGIARWARWGGARVSPHGPIATWLDSSVLAVQTNEVMGLALSLVDDPYRLNVLHYAVSYLTAAQFDVTAEMSTALCVSALSMLSYSRFVQEQSSINANDFEKMNTEEQIRLLLDECKIPIPAPADFSEIAGLQSQLATQGLKRDTLGTAIYLRNKMIHPTKKMPDEFSAYAWGEASIILRNYLTLAILNTLGYKGRYRSTVQGEMLPGASTPVPW